MSGFKFTESTDNAIMIQCLADKPFLAEHAESERLWIKVVINLSNIDIHLTPRAVESRYLSLLRKYREKQEIDGEKTGLIGKITDIDHVYNEIIKLIDESKEKKVNLRNLVMTDAAERPINIYRKQEEYSIKNRKIR